MAYLPSLPHPHPHPQEDGQSPQVGAHHLEGPQGSRTDSPYKQDSLQGEERPAGEGGEWVWVCREEGQGTEASCQAATPPAPPPQHLHWGKPGLADQKGRGGGKEWTLTTGY